MKGKFLYRRKRYKRISQLKRKKSLLKNRFFWRFLFILGILGTIFYFLIFSSIFQIKEIKISGNQSIATNFLKETIEPTIEKKFLFFSSRSIFLVNLKEINKVFSEKFPKLASVNLKRDFPDVLILEVKEREAVGVWCQKENCFLIDQEGVIFEKGLSETKLIIQSQEKEGESSLGEMVMEKNHLQSILEIQRKLAENFQIKIGEFFILPKGKLTARTTEGWQIYFDISGDIAKQILNLSLVLEKKISAEKRKNLEYIDLRFDNRVYYK